MIPLHSQTSSLDLSRKLEELGVTQTQSQFYWRLTGNNITTGKEEWVLSQNVFHGERDVYAAFTCAELGVLLDYRLPTLDCGKWIILWNGKIHGHADTETDARCKMLIHLLESKIITVEEVNQRLTKTEGGEG